MIAYFDTSALIPLLVAESGTPGAGRLWDEADRVVAARMLYAEARAVLAQAQRMDRLTAEGLREAVEGLDLLYGQLDRVEIDEHLVRRAGALAEHQLCGVTTRSISQRPSASRIPTRSWSLEIAACATPHGRWD